jgi:peptidoglycan L-alanyl-D-glutamate endopeptidase CwlK
MTYKFGSRSINNLVGVHEDLQRVMYAAISNSPYDFAITEGVRTPARQQMLYSSGASRTLMSRHLTGHAVDIALFDGGKVTWEFDKYKEVAEHIKAVAILNDVSLIWGGDWRGLVDGPHYELNKKDYPA